MHRVGEKENHTGFWRRAGHESASGDHDMGSIDRASQASGNNSDSEDSGGDWGKPCATAAVHINHQQHHPPLGVC
jgi:hypothetical protein